jgi:23S rRNA pseudouridine2605 synthase
VTRRRTEHERPAAQRSPLPGVRLQKFLSDAGVASRRHAEELILAGRVLVNNEVVDALPAFVDPAHDRIIVDGARVRPQRLEYFLVHKPKGVVCTNSDPAGRVRAIDLLPELPVRLFPVGRLDEESTGLLLMTNDGELAQRITHPRYGVPKTYYAEVRGRVPPDLPARMKGGVFLAEGRAVASEVKVVHSGSDRSALQITLREGRNRQVRRMLVRLGHPVRKLKRVQIGPLTLHGLPVGAARRLTVKELAQLRAACEQVSTVARGKRRRKAQQYKQAAARPAARRETHQATRRLIT